MSKPNVLFLGTHGQYNWGDELLLESFLHNFREAANNFYVNTYDIADTQKLFGSYDITPFHTTGDKAALLRYIWRADLVMFGGGSIVKELNPSYGGARYQTLNTLNTLTKAISLFPGKKIIYSNIGVGPLKTEKGKKLAYQILKRGEVVSLRDVNSVRLAKEINLKTAYEQVPDAVFSLTREYFGLSETPSKKSVSAVTGLQKVALNLCRNISNNANWELFQQNLLASLRLLLTRNPTLELIALPMQYDVEVNDDLREIKTVFTILKKEFPEATYTYRKPKSTRDIVATLEEADLVLAERLHLLILSTILQKPFVGLEYNTKVTGLLEDLELSEFGVKINEEFQAEEIFAKIELLVSRYDTVRQYLAAVYARLHQADTEFYARLKTRFF